MKRRCLLIATLTTLLLTFSTTPALAQFFPRAEITPDPLEFPDTRVGEASVTETLTISKTESFAPLYIAAVRLANTLDFVITHDGCSEAFLIDDETCVIRLDFRPNNTSHYNTSLSIISISQEIIDTVTITGEGVAPAVTLSVTSIDFGHQTINEPSAAHEVALVNSGTATLNISDIAPTGDFAVTDDCGDSVDAGEECTLEVVFTPTALGATTGTVTITDDASDSPQTIALEGAGIEPGQPDASLSRHAIDFGIQVVGTTSNTEAVTLTNSGTADLTITNIAVDGDYAQANDCGAGLVPDASCTVLVTFGPTATGTRTGTLTFTDDASDSPQEVSLTGMGTEQDTAQVNISATSLDFGNITVGQRSDPQTLTLTNTGTADLEVSGSSISGEGAHSFSQNDMCIGKSIAPNGTCTIEVAFSPALDGTLTATITITDNTSTSPQTITITGIGIAPGVSGGGCDLIGTSAGTSAGAAMLLLPIIFALRRRQRK